MFIFFYYFDNGWLTLYGQDLLLSFAGSSIILNIPSNPCNCSAILFKCAEDEAISSTEASCSCDEADTDSVLAADS
ncbi:hypothetical protein D3C74_471370 [compost metagenome]